MASIFHLSFHVRDLEQARSFYLDTLGCKLGDEAETWIDIDFFGHQLSLHVGEPFPTTKTGLVDGVYVSMPHFGVVLPMQEWTALVERLTAASVAFAFGPTIRYAGEPREQATAFFSDPSGNPIEIKGFNNLARVFTT